MTSQNQIWITAIASLFLLSLSKPAKLIIKSKTIEEKLAKVTDSLYLGKYEVSNKEFKEFITYLHSSNTKNTVDSYKSDSTKWLNHPNGGALSRFYFSHPAYDNYPVVAISYEAAEAYCKWLTNQYLSDEKRKFRKIIFRLPTENEWMESAYANNHSYKYPWGNYLIRRTGEYMAVYRKISDQRITYDTGSKTFKVVITESEIFNWDGQPVDVKTFWPNKLGIHHQSGNVAEMVMEKGIAKGGSFNDPGFDIQITSRKEYNEPTNEIGFRIAMLVLP